MTLAASNPPQSWCFRKPLGKNTHTHTPSTLFGLRKSSQKHISKTLHHGKLRGWNPTMEINGSEWLVSVFFGATSGILMFPPLLVSGVYQKILRKKLTSWGGCFNFQREFSARMSFLKIWHIRIFRGHLCVSLWEQIEKQNPLKQWIISWGCNAPRGKWVCWIFFGDWNPSLKTHVIISKMDTGILGGGVPTPKYHKTARCMQIYDMTWYDNCMYTILNDLRQYESVWIGTDHSKLFTPPFFLAGWFAAMPRYFT